MGPFEQDPHQWCETIERVECEVHSRPYGGTKESQIWCQVSRNASLPNLQCGIVDWNLTVFLLIFATHSCYRLFRISNNFPMQTAK